MLYNLSPAELPVEDDEPLDSPWHRMAINLLVSLLRFTWRGRDDYYTGGNMFIHFDLATARKKGVRGPDFFVVKEVDGGHYRESWIVWEEGGKYPNVIIELLSPSTAVFDKTEKKKLYQDTFRTPEYFCYHPHTEELLGWSLQKGAYRPLKANGDGRLWSNELQLWLGKWRGEYDGLAATWLRFYDEEGNLVLTREEAAEARAAELLAQLEQIKESKP
jgi:Uma2 family endonuclease